MFSPSNEKVSLIDGLSNYSWRITSVGATVEEKEPMYKHDHVTTDIECGGGGDRWTFIGRGGSPFGDLYLEIMGTVCVIVALLAGGVPSKDSARRPAGSIRAAKGRDMARVGTCFVLCTCSFFFFSV